MATAANIKKRDYISFRNDIYQVLSAEFYHPGKGRTVMRTKLRNIKTGRAVDHVFTSNEDIERLDIQSRSAHFLYSQNNVFVFMDEQTYEQYEISKKLLGSIADFLKEGQSIYILVHEDEAIGVIPPKRIVLVVKEAQDAAKGDTATNAKKQVKLETGAKLFVPLFIKKGDRIAVNPDTGTYTGRENE